MTERENMIERLKEQQTLERISMENILLRQIDACRQMRMLSVLERSPAYYWEAVHALIDLLACIAKEDFLEDIRAIDVMVERAQAGLKKQNEEHHNELPEGSRWDVDWQRYSTLYFQACMRHIQRMGLGLTLIEKEVW